MPRFLLPIAKSLLPVCAFMAFAMTNNKSLGNTVARAETGLLYLVPAGATPYDKKFYFDNNYRRFVAVYQGESWFFDSTEDGGESVHLVSGNRQVTARIVDLGNFFIDQNPLPPKAPQAGASLESMIRFQDYVTAASETALGELPEGALFQLQQQIEFASGKAEFRMGSQFAFTFKLLKRPVSFDPNPRYAHAHSWYKVSWKGGNRNDDKGYYTSHLGFVFKALDPNEPDMEVFPNFGDIVDLRTTVGRESYLFRSILIPKSSLPH